MLQIKQAEYLRKEKIRRQEELKRELAMERNAELNRRRKQRMYNIRRYGHAGDAELSEEREDRLKKEEKNKAKAEARRQRLL